MKPCIWICPRHGALPEGEHACTECADAADVFLANLPGQLNLLAEADR